VLSDTKVCINSVRPRLILTANSLLRLPA
jgi:hypothetical protein